MESASELIEHTSPWDLVQAGQTHRAVGVVLEKTVSENQPDRRKIVEPRPRPFPKPAVRLIVGSREGGDDDLSQGFDRSGSSLRDSSFARDLLCDGVRLLLHL